jgi:predicted DNA-binding protein (MmcQ/YjbR family)
MGIVNPMRRAAMLAFCRKLPHVTEDVKWGNDLVFSIGKKMFACFDFRGGPSLGFKATPENFTILTRTPGIIPAPYAARFHWVMVHDLRKLPLSALKELVSESYQLVSEKLPARMRRTLGLSDATESQRTPKATRSRPRPRSSKRRRL